MWETFKIPVITAAITTAFIFFARWFENFIRNRIPLKITILSDDISFTDIANPLSYPKFFLPINFTNRAPSDYEISFSNFKINPKKISNIEFTVSNRVYEEKWKVGTPMSKFAMDRNSKCGYLLIGIIPFKDCNWNELYEILNNNIKSPFEVSFNYRLSIETKKRNFNKKLKGLMNSLVEKVYNYKRQFEE